MLRLWSEFYVLLPRKPLLITLEGLHNAGETTLKLESNSLESMPDYGGGKPRVYSGNDLIALLETLNDWFVSVFR